jgi:redox-sensing transcriptional repressor
MGLDIPPATAARLATYRRLLEEMEDGGRKLASSDDLAAAAGVSPAQVRRDLSHFGHFGKHGPGYDIRYLIELIRDTLAGDES